MNHTGRAFKAGDLILGGLFPVHSHCSNCCQGRCGDLRSLDAAYFAEAMMYAIDETNRNSSILQGISLGFEIFDYCSKDVIALEKASNFIPSCWKKPSPPVVGVVGPYSSSIALQVSNLLGLFKVPHVSYGATSPLLSDKARFKYFIRTVPSDAVRAQALVDVLLKNETKYVSVLYSDDEFGREAKKYFTQAAKERGICIGIKMALPQGDTVSTFDEVVMDISQKINAQVIVLFCSKSDISLLFKLVKKFGKESFFRWLIGGDYAEISVYLNGNEDIANNIVLCSPRNERSTRFMEWRKRNNVSHSPWLSEIELQYKTSKYRPENEGKAYSADLYIQSVINSVYTFAHALDKICKTYCKNNSSAATCLKEKSRNQNLLMDYILDVNYTTLNGRRIEFDKNGDISAEYDILRPVKDGISWGVKRIGRWGPPIKGAGPVEVQLFEEALILPRAYCSRPCDVGERQITIEVCCWRCEPCKADEITSSNQTECTPCTRDFMPDEKRVKCLPKPVINIDSSSSLLLFTKLFSATGILCTLFMLGVFVVLKHHPVIKASSRELSCLLLVGIMISFAESFLDLMEPDKRVCSLRGYNCLGHVTCYAVMTSKALRVNRLFNSSLLKTLNPTFVSTRSQLGFIGFILGIALLFSTIWGFFTILRVGLVWGLNPRLPARQSTKALHNICNRANNMADATDCRGNWIFSGPDGIKPFSRYKLHDTSYVGRTTFSLERTSDVKHIWRAPWWTANFPAKSDWVGAIGWNVWSYNDWRLLKSGHQITAGPFRTATAHRIVNEGVY
ncbi:Metabotropic glutamate receptor 4 [Stylophora pistillata]|uniref:Metabotropic glutamate receptor 4 n=1 Tax=Stylophora pistillata TaxID=50429 RepID=A0A2B4SED7_STYPI|nr:Metabotropic glutamate receptor 4 [Stylophora pistillata]